MVTWLRLRLRNIRRIRLQDGEPKSLKRLWSSIFKFWYRLHLYSVALTIPTRPLSVVSRYHIVYSYT
jgi:hypothetical protein